MRANTKKRPDLSSLLVKPLFTRLLEHFGPQNWWPAQSAWEMMVGAILVQNTAWTNVEKALTALKKTNALSVAKIASMPRRRLEQLIRPSGYFRQKAKRLQMFAREMQKDPEFFRELQTPSGDPSVLRQRLLSLHGIGPETADSILLYAGGYPVFVVDAYTRRLGHRMDLFKSDDYHEVQRLFENSLPRRAALYNEYHALIVALAKRVCTSRAPKCPECPVSTLCAFAKAARLGK